MPGRWPKSIKYTTIDVILEVTWKRDPLKDVTELIVLNLQHIYSLKSCLTKALFGNNTHVEFRKRREDPTLLKHQDGMIKFKTLAKLILETRTGTCTDMLTKEFLRLEWKKFLLDLQALITDSL